MREQDEPEFRIEGFSENPLEMQKEIEDLKRRRDDIFNEIKKTKQNKNEETIEFLDVNENYFKFSKGYEHEK